MGLRRKAARRVAPCKGAGGPKHCVCVCARARLSGVCACVFACACACVRACVCARARARSRVRYNPVVRPALCTQAGKRRPAGRVLRHRPTAWGGPLRAARGRVERPAAGCASTHTRYRGITAAATVRGDGGGGGGGRFVQGGFYTLLSGTFYTLLGPALARLRFAQIGATGLRSSGEEGMDAAAIEAPYCEDRSTRSTIFLSPSVTFIEPAAPRALLALPTFAAA